MGERLTRAQISEKLFTERRYGANRWIKKNLSKMERLI